MELTYFKLFTQEEVIAPAKKTEEGWYVENPAILVHLQDYKIALANWLPYTTVEAGATIPDKTIAMSFSVAEDMAEYYIKWMNPDNTEFIKVNSEGQVQSNK